MAVWIANTAAIAAPVLAFMAGVYFAKWMRQRRDRRAVSRQPAQFCADRRVKG